MRMRMRRRCALLLQTCAAERWRVEATMERTARPATVGDLKHLIKALNDEGVEYLLVGAYALFALGYQRATRVIE